MVRSARAGRTVAQASRRGSQNEQNEVIFDMIFASQPELLITHVHKIKGVFISSFSLLFHGRGLCFSVKTLVLALYLPGDEEIFRLQTADCARQFFIRV